jgi:hypothetical protein
MLAEVVTANRICRLAYQFAYEFLVGNRWGPDVCLVEPKANGVERVNVNPFRQAGFAAQKPFS